MLRLPLATAFLAALSIPCIAATSAIAVSPPRVAVLGGTLSVFVAQFFDASGKPAVGPEQVTFFNDACGGFNSPGGGSFATSFIDNQGKAYGFFYARPQGITCRVSATAGAATVSWDVLTYTAAQVHLETVLNPPRPRPGQPFSVTVTPMAGAYPLYATEVSGVVDGRAISVTPVLNTGQAGTVQFEYRPYGGVGAFDVRIGLPTVGVVKTVSIPAPERPWQEMWWGGPAEAGWGVSIVQHREQLFAVIYGYDTAGLPTWFVLPGGAWNADRTQFTGAVYRPRGSPFTAYDASRLVVGPALGTASLTVIDGGHLSLEYTLSGTQGRKTLERQDFGAVDVVAVGAHGDMWWGGPAQNGWGIAIQQQYRTLFTTWFTYDAAGAPTWFVMPSGAWTSSSTYEGRIFRATGSPWLGASYDPRAFRTSEVGTFLLRLTQDGATFDYTVEGRSGTMALSRQPF